jgi:hypothetical protein
MTTPTDVHRSVERTYGKASMPTTGKNGETVLDLGSGLRPVRKLASRVVAGHLWSSRFTARRA